MSDKSENKDTSKKDSKKKDTSPALKRSWFTELKAEFKKITWPKKDQLFKEAVVVLVSAISIGLIIVLVDWLLNLGLSYIW
ncbi:MAG: preprotein translocase subunit SecE [Eubacterium sp.]|nr:preprotein translocase subunit SecE [Eubacterium sp.]